MKQVTVLRARVRAVAAAVRKAAVGFTDVSAMIPGPWRRVSGETYTGSWQQGVQPETPETLLAFAAVYGCVTLIAGDIAKLTLRLTALEQGVWVETSNSAYSPVLRKPNRYQTKSQFLMAWVVSKLLWGNTFVLKERDQRGVVVALYVLDPALVRVVVSSDGGVYYSVMKDMLAAPQGGVLVPASEIIHDRAICPFHPLIGVGPLHAAAVSATQGRKIQTNSSVFFQNMSRPSGQLTSPDEIGDETADRLKREFEERFSGANVGRLLVAGSGLKYEAMTMPAEQAQLIEQLGWTGEDCVRPFLVPAYKLGLGNPPTFNNIGQLSQEYYSTCLQGHMDGIETLLSEGLGLALNLRVDIDEEGLLRMDPLARADRAQKLMQAGAMAPDQARATEGWLPLPDGAGKVPFMQQQNYPVTVLAKRTDLMPQPAPAAPAGPATAPAPAPAADPAKALEEAERMTAELFDRIIRGLDVDA